jgi:outer membrane lipoprotein-sorting protein
MKWILRTLIWGICCGTLFLSSCCLPGRRFGKELEPIETSDEKLSTLTSAEVSDAITQRSEQFHTLRGLGKVHLDVWEEKYQFSEVFVIEKPDKFRLETLGAFDQPAVFLTSDGHRVSSYSKKQNTYMTGIASQENLFQLSGINFSVEDMILVFSGNPPLLSHIDYEWGFYVPSLQRYFLERRSRQDNIGQRIWFDVTRQVIAEIQEYRLTNGTITLTLVFADYRTTEDEGGYPIPGMIKIHRPLEETRLDVTYDFFDVNQSIDDPTLFDFKPPEDARKYNLDDKTREPLKVLPPYKEFQVQPQQRK